ncbi:10984_t:CDS:2 [Paraglomus brasilianum]|uniref:10984_t:CDS:1 n=1 Tax=Paraglomus brasilianum TaxID=144538 RepID=A0A9N9F5X2_9GLOM|nr:10984_t:CDS:2 [Paraglomus brasilianum]
MNGFRGYAGRFQSDDVAYVERDLQVHTTVTMQHGVWLSYLSCTIEYDYFHTICVRTNYQAYVIDTGININHTDFGGRAKWGVTIPVGTPNTDDNRHETHVAGTITGSKYGVSKSAKVVAVKRYNQWSVREASRAGKVYKGSVINTSLLLLIWAVIIAAGNSMTDACNGLPSRAAKAIAVGATTIEDTCSWFSNFGCCVTIWAPITFGIHVPSHGVPGGFHSFIINLADFAAFSFRHFF